MSSRLSLASETRLWQSKRWGEMVTETGLGTLKVPARGKQDRSTQRRAWRQQESWKATFAILKCSTPFLRADCTNTGKPAKEREVYNAPGWGSCRLRSWNSHLKVELPYMDTANSRTKINLSYKAKRKEAWNLKECLLPEKRGEGGDRVMLKIHKRSERLYTR